MADETKVQEKMETATAAVATPVKVEAAAVQPTVQAKVLKPAAKAATKVAKATAKGVDAVKQVNKRAAKKVKRARKAAPVARATKIEGTKSMNYDFNQLFTSFQLPGTEKVQALFADAGERSQAYVAKSQKAAEEMTDLAKANVEAFVEAGKIAATGAKAIGQDVIASGREGVEQASDAMKTLAEAKSPAEFFQIQSELARASFDRFVAESSKLTERVVKLAGETAEPLQTRASLNAERVNTLVA
ncbi:phasin family protein [Sphingomonas xanthus]|uniref:Phasin family protein n=1 Tax=Sphingomonas xanthus TaxID=2594473 RepID=A0A516ISF3_9SPHN|nr:phasin family protein [Sphingomonas xanthus]QDP19817.1 phasin family protein [Sphingomonas xanthus]